MPETATRDRSAAWIVVRPFGGTAIQAIDGATEQPENRISRFGAVLWHQSTFLGETQPAVENSLCFSAYRNDDIRGALLGIDKADSLPDERCDN